MSNQAEVVDLIKAISGQANIIAVPRLFVSLLDGDIIAALLLSQIVYWSDKSKRKDGWFYKSYAEWKEELGLTQYRVKRAADALEENGLIETKVKRADGAPTVHYKLDISELSSRIIKFLDNQKTSFSLTKTTSLKDSVRSPSVSESLDTKESSNDPRLKSSNGRKLTETQLWVKVLCEVCDMDPKLMGGRVAKRGKNLRDAGYTLEDIQRLYGKHGWWYRFDFRGKKGQPPTPEQIEKTILRALDEEKKLAKANAKGDMVSM